MSTFRLHIATPESDFYSGEVEYLSFETTDGRVGIMRGALAGIYVLKSGRIDIRSMAVDESFMCGDGLVRVNADGVSVLTSYCGETDERDGSAVVEEASENDGSADDGHEYKYAKARITSSILKMKDKQSGNE